MFVTGAKTNTFVISYYYLFFSKYCRPSGFVVTRNIYLFPFWLFCLVCRSIWTCLNKQVLCHSWNEKWKNDPLTCPKNYHSNMTTFPYLVWKLLISYRFFAVHCMFSMFYTIYLIYVLNLITLYRKIHHLNLSIWCMVYNYMEPFHMGPH